MGVRLTEEFVRSVGEEKELGFLVDDDRVARLDATLNERQRANTTCRRFRRGWRECCKGGVGSSLGALGFNATWTLGDDDGAVADLRTHSTL